MNLEVLVKKWSEAREGFMAHGFSSCTSDCGALLHIMRDETVPLCELVVLLEQFHSRSQVIQSLLELERYGAFINVSPWITPSSTYQPGAFE